MSEKKSMRFQPRIFLTVICVALVPIILCFTLLLPVMVSTSTKRQSEAAQAQLDVLSGQLTDAFSGMERVLDALAQDAWIRSAIEESDTAHPRELYAALVRQAADVPEMTQLMLIDSDGACLCALRGQEENVVFDTDWGVLRMAEDENVVFFGEAGRVAAVRRVGAGYLLAEISGDSLSELLSQGLNPAYGVMLLGGQWRLIDDSRTTGSESRLHELRERMLAGEALSDSDSVLTYTTQTEPVSGFTLLLSQPRVFTGEMTHLMVVIGVALGTASLLLCLWGALVLSRQVTRPVREMTAAMKRVQMGELSARVVPHGGDELGQLAVGFNRMVEECELNLRRSVERQKELNDTRIRMMQSQLNPHFLFNTLNTLKWIATLNHVTPVSHGIDALSSLLQSTLIKKDELIPFDDELRNLKNYCDIQQLRYAGRFEMEYQIEDAAGYWTVPRFILQPLVENSILHGTADEDDFVTITVRATVSENLLTIHISDTGCGFDPRAIKEKNSERFSGIGLSNVDERMRLHYGNEYGLTIESAPGIGTQCILCIPNEAIR